MHWINEISFQMICDSFNYEFFSRKRAPESSYVKNNHMAWIPYKITFSMIGHTWYFICVNCINDSLRATGVTYGS